MDGDSDDSVDSNLSTGSKRSKIKRQLNDAERALKEIKTLLDPKSKRDAQFSAYHDYVLWLIRNNYVHGNSDIVAFVAGLIHRLFCHNKEVLPLSLVAEHFRVSASTMSRVARKYTAAFQTLYWNKHAFDLEFKGIVKTFSWDLKSKDLEQILDKIVRVFELDCPLDCYIVSEEIYSGRTASIGILSEVNWDAGMEYFLTEDKEKCRTFRKQNKKRRKERAMQMQFEDFESISPLLRDTRL